MNLSELIVTFAAAQLVAAAVTRQVKSDRSNIFSLLKTDCLAMLLVRHVTKVTKTVVVQNLCNSFLSLGKTLCSTFLCWENSCKF